MALLSRVRTSATDHEEVAGGVGEALLGDPRITRGILDAVQANIFVADPGLNLVYMNARAEKTVLGFASEVQKVFRVGLNDLLGGSIHRFHRDPARVERVLHDPSALPHRAQFTFGEITLDTRINRVCTPDGALAGYVVAWEDVTEKILAQQAAEEARQKLCGALRDVECLDTSLQTVASAMEEMSAASNEIARTGASATEVVRSTVRSVESANRTMQELGEASTKINEIVKTITQVAEQTNLLALNATIEAARAGEAGKGFAVVAGEVKELSKQTKAATERISQMVESVQRLSSDAMAAIGEVSSEVGQMESGQLSIVSAVEEQSATSQEISRSLTEAAQSGNNIGTGLAAYVAKLGVTCDD